jgi:hypothetical protein
VLALFITRAAIADTATTPAIIAPIFDAFISIYYLYIIHPMIILNPPKKYKALFNHYHSITLFHWKREMSVERRNESQKKGGIIPQFFYCLIDWHNLT